MLLSSRTPLVSLEERESDGKRSEEPESGVGNGIREESEFRETKPFGNPTKSISAISTALAVSILSKSRFQILDRKELICLMKSKSVQLDEN